MFFDLSEDGIEKSDPSDGSVRLVPSSELEISVIYSNKASIEYSDDGEFQESENIGRSSPTSLLAQKETFINRLFEFYPQIAQITQIIQGLP